MKFSFSITNLDLGSVGQELSLTLEGFALVIRPIQSYSEIVVGLRAIRVDITCQALFTADSIEHGGTLSDSINLLCQLLTLARGSRVEWISYDVMTIEGQVCKSFHRNAITKPFGHLCLGPIPARDTVEFITKTYPALQRGEQEWELRKAIAAYTDAKIEVDFLESRALKMVVVMEHLKGKYLTRSNKVHVISPRLFRKYEHSIVMLVRWILHTMFPKTEPERVELMANHSKGFNWYPFRRALSDLSKTIGLKTTSAERNRFCEIRNELVHRMGFHSELGSAWEQYTFVMTFNRQDASSNTRL